MRRAPPLAQLSPSLIKHFAFATVALTGLLAVFASGEDWGTAAQIKAVNDRNQLETAEVSKFGAKKLAAKIELRDGGPPPAFNSDVLIEHHRTSAAYSPSASTGGPEDDYAAGSDYIRAEAAAPAADSRQGPPEAPPIPGIATKRPRAKPLIETAPPPTAQQIAAITARSIERSAGVSGD